MPYDPTKHHRRSIRLKGYDYSRPGAYFVTICTQDRACLFGDVIHQDMSLNGAGAIVQKTWIDLPNRFPTIQLDEFVVMPNHVHGIIVMTDNHTTTVGAGLALPHNHTHNHDPRGIFGTGSSNLGTCQGAASSAPALGDVVRVFKSISAIAVNRFLSRLGQPLWQRNYYERIVRDPVALSNIRRYIKTNPQNWAEDTNNRR
jgi:putative transposase